MSIDGRIEAFAYQVGFLATFAMPVQVPKEMEALQRLKARFEGETRLVREFCLRKPESKMLSHFFIEDFAE